SYFYEDSAGRPLVVGEWLFLQANDNSSGTELWKSNGTEAGTTLVKDIAPAWESGSPQELGHCGARLYFTAYGGWTEGREIWLTDGSPEGTLATSDLAPSGGGPAPAQLKCWSDQLYFVYDDRQHGSELWKLPAVTQSNQAPSAVADSATTVEDTPVNLPVLANDLEPDLDALHVVAAAAPAHGTAAI